MCCRNTHKLKRGLTFQAKALHRNVSLWLKAKLSWAVYFNLKKTVWTFQVWFKEVSMQGKTARIWRIFGGERDHYRQKSRFRERKVAIKPGILPQTTSLNCMRSSWQFPFKAFAQNVSSSLWVFLHRLRNTQNTTFDLSPLFKFAWQLSWTGCYDPISATTNVTKK